MPTYKVDFSFESVSFQSIRNVFQNIFNVTFIRLEYFILRYRKFMSRLQRCMWRACWDPSITAQKTYIVHVVIMMVVRHCHIPIIWAAFCSDVSVVTDMKTIFFQILANPIISNNKITSLPHHALFIPQWRTKAQKSKKSWRHIFMPHLWDFNRINCSLTRLES